MQQRVDWKGLKIRNVCFSFFVCVCLLTFVALYLFGMVWPEAWIYCVIYRLLAGCLPFRSIYLVSFCSFFPLDIIPIAHINRFTASPNVGLGMCLYREHLPFSSSLLLVLSSFSCSAHSIAICHSYFHVTVLLNSSINCMPPPPYTAFMHMAFIFIAAPWCPT